MSTLSLLALNSLCADDHKIQNLQMIIHRKMSNFDKIEQLKKN
jgi:hypothetical protein